MFLIAKNGITVNRNVSLRTFFNNTISLSCVLVVTSVRDVSEHWEGEVAMFDDDVVI